MRIAQQLYEGIALEKKQATGLITYMRTDSLSLSKEAVSEIREVIGEKFGKNYVPESANAYKTKSKGAQEAHEAIRPTSAKLDPEYLQQFLDSKQYRLYKLIWDRTVASQMAPAKMDSTSVEIKATQKSKEENYWLKATGSIIKFDGYLALSGSKREDEILPDLQEDENVNLIEVNADQKETQPPARYSEATLVKALEEHGIGRPSTYAPTISTVQDRGYVEKDDSKKLFPTETGIVVNSLLVKHFDKIVDYEFTAELEKSLDEIAEGKKEWTNVIKNFYEPFIKNVNTKDKEIEKSDFQKKLNKKCPECGSELLEKFGRFGKFIACSNYPECKYTEKTSDDKKQENEIKKQEGGKDGKIICDKCGKEMEVKRGRFGMFIGCTGYPECKNIKKVENKTGVKCPKCGENIVEKKSKKGRMFYGCSGYPKCEFALWSKPTGDKCPKCKSLVVLGPKDTVKCSNKECGYKKEQKPKL
jgi:DNA topoisomerase-1